MWFIRWLLAWLALIAAYVASWFVGIILYTTTVFTLIAFILYMTGSGPGNRCDSSSAGCTTQGSPPDTRPHQVVGPVPHLGPENPQSCDVNEEIASGARLIQRYGKYQNDIKTFRASLDRAGQSKLAQSKLEWDIQLHQKALETLTQRRDQTYQLYVNKLQQITKDCRSKLQTIAPSDFKEEAISTDGTVPFVQFEKIFVSEAQAYQRDGVIDESRLVDKIPATQ